MNKKDRNNTALCSAVEPLLAWYRTNKRPLPWRQSPTPYQVWISEIMLQQTRIEAVIPYYERFLSELPTVKDLALVDDERLMKLWEGLGYYSRARNLKKAALTVMERHEGRMPTTYEELLSLPGIGPYTAGAIASIAFGLPEPAVDGNVLRVITRLTADERDVTKQTVKQDVTQALRAVYPSKAEDASAMTQALMELGERVCLPNGTPRCDECPLGLFCRARAADLTDRIPVRAPKKPRRIEQRTVLLLVSKGRVALVKRPPTGLLAGLWEFPTILGPLSQEATKRHLQSLGMAVSALIPCVSAVHIFSHIEWHMQSYLAVCDEWPKHWDGAAVRAVTLDELRTDYAVGTAHRAFVQALESELKQSLADS
jgi:A/G-specific adenine glycosylase